MYAGSPYAGAPYAGTPQPIIPVITGSGSGSLKSITGSGSGAVTSPTPPTPPTPQPGLSIGGFFGYRIDPARERKQIAGGGAGYLKSITGSGSGAVTVAGVGGGSLGAITGVGFGFVIDHEQAWIIAELTGLPLELLI